MIPDKLRVLVADDEQVARQRLLRLLCALPDVEVAGEARDGDEVLTRVAGGGIEVVLLDIQMPKLSGVEALALPPSFLSCEGPTTRRQQAGNRRVPRPAVTSAARAVRGSDLSTVVTLPTCRPGALPFVGQPTALA